ncbi:hypothetical protein MMC25_002705 [Agyrium rufum]|nr:hypothetical protein [Agyrium rufum]
MSSPTSGAPRTTPPGPSSTSSPRKDESTNLFPYLPPYTPPRTGLLSYLPSSLVPYAELMRLHRPAGYYAFYFPHLFGTLYASAILPSLSAQSLSSGPTILTPSSQSLIPLLLRANLFFLPGCLLLRGASCSWNDTVDIPYDRRVARCRHRPLARGALSANAAHAFTIAQSLLGIGLTLIPLNSAVRLPASLLGVTMAIYPFCKRVTHYPQIVLGFSLALGQFVGAAATGLDPVSLISRAWQNGGIGLGGWGLSGDRGREGQIGTAMIYFYGANVLNTIIYDAVYAHQDLADDVKAGVKSVAVAWREKTQPVIMGLAAAEIGLLTAAGYFSGFGSGYFGFAVGGTAAVLGTMVTDVRLDVPESCAKWFGYLLWGTGATISIGLGWEAFGSLGWRDVVDGTKAVW